MTNVTLIRFVEAFVAVFVVTLAADPIFGQPLDLTTDGLQALGVALASAALLAVRRVLATRSE